MVQSTTAAALAGFVFLFGLAGAAYLNSMSVSCVGTDAGAGIVMSNCFQNYEAGANAMLTGGIALGVGLGVLAWRSRGRASGSPVP